MQKLVNPNEVPPDGFRFLQAETRTWIRAPDYSNLFLNVRQHRKANNIPLGPLWEAQVENALCEMLPPGSCRQEDPAANRRNVFNRVSWEDVVSGTKAIAAWATSGFKAVDQALADSRANTCSRCYYNVNIGGICGSCQHLHNLTATFTRGRQTAFDAFLRACAVCKCGLQVKVWTPIEAIDQGTKDTSPYPSFCWLRNELEEFRKKKV